jgi:hypothetical protein
VRDQYGHCVLADIAFSQFSSGLGVSTVHAGLLRRGHGALARVPEERRHLAHLAAVPESTQADKQGLYCSSGHPTV